jgi:hypothetical protein
MLKLFTTTKPLKAEVESFNQTRGISPTPFGTKEYFHQVLGTEVFYGDGANGYRAIEECGTSSFTIE